MPKRNTGPRLEWREDRNTWEIIWFERGSRRRKSTGESSRQAAETKFAEHLLMAGSGKKTNTCDPDQRLIDDILADYAVERGQYLARRDVIALSIEHLTGFWGGKPAAAVNEPACRAYAAWRQDRHRKRLKNAGKALKQLSAATLERELSVLSAAIRHDHAQGRLTRPCPVWTPRRTVKKDRWLTRPEAARLLRAARQKREARNHLPLFILLALYTGARKEAILSLRWPQVDLARGLIDLNPPGRERTTKGRPIIPIPRRLLGHLKRARRRGVDLGYVIHRNQTPLGDIKKSFKTACEAAGLKNVTPHTLRHTAASWMAQKGVPFPKIARYLGHRSSRMTEEVYAHHTPDYLKEAAESF